MRVSYNWLKDYVDLDLSPSDLGDRLTMAGLEVEEIHDRYAFLTDVVVALVAAVEDHPKADHLKICRVEARGQSFPVVCGAPNCRAGMLSALALVGAELVPGKPLAETEIRGARSVGMLCSEAELGVGPDASGIMDLTGRAEKDQDLQTALGISDWILEIGITPNRPDCLSLIGVAREAAAIVGQPIKYPEIRFNEGVRPASELSSVKILAPDACPRYTARIITGLKVGPSPDWLVRRLTSAGIRSISNLVDVTNFVMMEMGQPLHAFDMNHLEERRIVVDKAEEGDRFVTLDGTERILNAQALMIRDGKKAVGVAGVMGGLNSEITDQTTDVLLESAYFDPVSIRRTSKNLGLSTEASYRFERGIDPEGCARACDRAAALMAELGGGEIAAGIIDECPGSFPKAHVGFSPSRCNSFLGTDFDPEQMVEKLRSIELEVTGFGDVLVVTPPTFRVDLTREEDIFEEVARLIGYNEIPATLPGALVEPEPVEPSLILRSQAREILTGLGLSEVINYSFISDKFPEQLLLPENDPRRQVVEILNPLSEDQSVMRSTLVPSLLDTLRRNQAHNVMDVAIFEIGMVYQPVEGRPLPEERLTLGGLISGARDLASWRQQRESIDFYDLKGVVEDLLEGLRLPEPRFGRMKTHPAFLSANASAEIEVQGRVLGWVGRIQTLVADNFDLKDIPFLFELDLGSILAVQKGIPRFEPLPRYPAVSRDLALVLSRDVEAGRVVEAIGNSDEPHLTDTLLFDVYEGPQVGEGKKSLAFRLMYRSFERTLTDQEVNEMHQRITDRVLSEFQAALRT